MLPACRTECIPCPIPKFNLNESDIDGFMDELKTYHEQKNKKNKGSNLSS
jgi:hypothetical protein